MNTMKSLSVVVTGASTGIGKAIAHHFLTHGHRVVINSSNQENLARTYRELGPSADLAMVVGDISDPAVGQRLIDTAVEQFGGVDVLINNAGIFAPKPFLAVKEADLDRFLGVNLKGTFFATQAAIRDMLQHGGGSVINFSTALVDHAVGGFPASAAVASKGSIHALTRQLATEFGKDNIRANTLSLGVIRTPLLTKMGVTDADSLAGMHLLNRIGELSDVTEMVYAVATSKFITGATINLDGGHVAGHIPATTTSQDNQDEGATMGITSEMG